MILWADKYTINKAKIWKTANQSKNRANVWNCKLKASSVQVDFEIQFGGNGLIVDQKHDLINSELMEDLNHQLNTAPQCYNRPLYFHDNQQTFSFPL